MPFCQFVHQYMLSNSLDYQITLPLLLWYYDESKFKTTPTNNYNMMVSDFSYEFIRANTLQQVMDSLKFNLQYLVNWF